MCQRMYPLTVEEAEEALDARRRTGRSRLGESEDGLDPARDAWPGSLVAAYVPGEDGALATVSLVWGFDSPRGGRPVFNTRLDTALAQLRDGRGMWAEAMATGRCPVPCRGREVETVIWLSGDLRASPTVVVLYFPPSRSFDRTETP